MNKPEELDAVSEDDSGVMGREDDGVDNWDIEPEGDHEGDGSALDDDTAVLLPLGDNVGEEDAERSVAFEERGKLEDKGLGDVEVDMIPERDAGVVLLADTDAI